MIYMLLPAYNAEESLAPLLPKIDKVFKENMKLDYQIIVCDDGSRDKTPIMLEEYSKIYPMTIITHNINRGLGETSRDLFEKAAELANDDDIIILRRKCKLMMSQQPYVESFKELRHGVFRKPVVKEKNWSVLLNFIGLSKEVDLILEKLVSSYEFKSIMEGFFGKGYKTWAWSLRLSTTSVR